MFATSLRFDPSVAYGTLLPHVDRMDWTYRRVRRSQVCNQLDIALQKHRSLCLAAIAMAAHPRLGARSPLAIMDAELLQEILRLSAC